MNSHNIELHKIKKFVIEFLDIIHCPVFYLNLFLFIEIKNRMMDNIQKLNNCYQATCLSKQLRIIKGE
jgi:hypothetical protein